MLPDEPAEFGVVAAQDAEGVRTRRLGNEHMERELGEGAGGHENEVFAID